MKRETLSAYVRFHVSKLGGLMTEKVQKAEYSECLENSELSEFLEFSESLLLPCRKLSFTLQIIVFYSIKSISL